MKKAKTFIALIAAATLGTTALGLCACTDDKEPDSSNTNTNTNTTVTPEPDNNSTPAPTATYTITFDANDGTFADEKTTVTATTTNGKVTLPTAPTRVDYAFVKWTVKKDGTGSEITANYEFTADTTVYAQWELNVIEVTLNYKGSTGSWVKVKLSSKSDFAYDFRLINGKIQESRAVYLTTQHKAHYTDFKGYFDKQSGGNKVDITKEFTESIELWAQYGN